MQTRRQVSAKCSKSDNVQAASSYNNNYVYCSLIYIMLDTTRSHGNHSLNDFKITLPIDIILCISNVIKICTNFRIWFCASTWLTRNRTLNIKRLQVCSLVSQITRCIDSSSVIYWHLIVFVVLIRSADRKQDNHYKNTSDCFTVE